METDIFKSQTLRDYLRIVFKHKLIIITTMVVLTLTVYASLSMNTPIYEASVKMMKEGEKTLEAEYYDTFRRSTRSLGDVELAKASPIIERTVKALKLYAIPLDYEKQFATWLKSYLIEYQAKKTKRMFQEMSAREREESLLRRAERSLKHRVHVNSVGETNIFEISVTDFSPQAAVIIANVLSRSYVIYDLERQLAEVRLKYGEKHSIIQQISGKIEEMEGYLDSRILSNMEALGPASVKIIGQAVDAKPMKKFNKQLILFLTFVLSIIAGISISILIESLDDKIKTPNEIKSFLKIPFLGSLPAGESKNSNLDMNYASYYQRLSERLSILINDKQFKSILITDAESSDDTAVVLANISKCIVQRGGGQKILVVDSNLRKPQLSKMFNLNNTPGLSEVLHGKHAFEDVINDLGGNLHVLTAGAAESNPITLLDSARMFELIRMAKQTYNMVFLSCADLKNFTDAVVVSSVIDAYILVVNEGKVRRQVVNFSLKPLRDKKANIVGAILNNRKMEIPKFIYDRI